MSNISSAKPTASRYVNAVCIAAEDMGIIETKYGKKPMLKFTFEIDELDQYGSKRKLTRLFHKHTHSMSALSVAAKSWCDRDLAEEEENTGDVDWQSFVDLSACLKIEPGLVKEGKRYINIVEILAGQEDDPKTADEPETTN